MAFCGPVPFQGPYHHWVLRAAALVEASLKALNHYVYTCVFITVFVCTTGCIAPERHDLWTPCDLGGRQSQSIDFLYLLLISFLSFFLFDNIQYCCFPGSIAIVCLIFSPFVVAIFVHLIFATSVSYLLHTNWKNDTKIDQKKWNHLILISINIVVLTWTSLFNCLL